VEENNLLEVKGRENVMVMRWRREKKGLLNALAVFNAVLKGEVRGFRNKKNDEGSE
jgi:hypothetical protein